MVPAPHRLFLDRAVAELSADDRIVGVGIGGSWLGAALDEYSDLDLVIAGRPVAQDALLRDRQAIAERLGDLLSAFPGDHVGEPRLLICLYAPGPLHVDLKFVSVDDLIDRVEDPAILWERDDALRRVMARRPARWPPVDLQWIEDRFWTWIHYGATKLGRGELFEVIGFLAFLRERVFGPLAHVQHGGQPRATRRLETGAPAAVPALAATVAGHDPSACAAALRAAVDLYRAQRAQLAPPTLARRARAEAAAVSYLDDVARRLA